MRPLAWTRDRRVVAGAALIVAGVIGAVVFSRGDVASTSVLVPGRDLPPGHVLEAADLIDTPVEVRPEALRRLFTADRRKAVEGRAVVRLLRAGELIGLDDVSDRGPSLREVSVPVVGDHGPPGRLDVGDRVDVLATFGESDAARTVAVARAVQVVGLTSPRSVIAGGDLGPVVAVTVACDAATASRVVFAGRSAKVDVVRVVGDDGAPPTAVGFDDLRRLSSVAPGGGSR